MYTYRNKHERNQTVVSAERLPRLDYLPNWERTEDTEPADLAGNLVEKGPVQVVKGDQHTDVTLLPQARKVREAAAKAPAKKAATRTPAKTPAKTEGDGGQGAGDKKD